MQLLSLIPLLINMLPIDNSLKITIISLATILLTTENIDIIKNYLFNKFEVIFNKNFTCRVYEFYNALNIDNNRDDKKNIVSNSIYVKYLEYITKKFGNVLEYSKIDDKNDKISIYIDKHQKTLIDIYENKNIYINYYKSNSTSNDPSYFEMTSELNMQMIKEYISKCISYETIKTLSENNITTYDPITYLENFNTNTFSRWRLRKISTTKTEHNTFFPKEMKEVLTNTIDTFVNNPNTYIKYGIPYKVNILIYGKPGMGKSSFIKVLGKKYNIPIFCIDINILDSNKCLSRAFDDINDTMKGKLHIVLFEDIDKTSLFVENSDCKITMDCLINLLDGVKENYGRITVITSNSDIILKNQALCRAGRMDKIVNLDLCDNEQIKEIYNLFFPDQTSLIEWDNYTLRTNISSSELFQYFWDNNNNPQKAFTFICEPVA